MIELLEWAEMKAATVDMPCSVAITRAIYLQLPVTFAHIRNRTRDVILAYDLEFAYNLSHNLAHVLKCTEALVLNRKRGLDLPADHFRDPNLFFNIDRVRADSINRAFDRANDLDRIFISQLKLDFRLMFSLHIARNFGLVEDDSIIRFQFVRFAEHFKENIQLIPDDVDLTQDLSNLAIPTVGSSTTESKWRQFSKQYQTVLQTHRILGHVWELTEKDLTDLAVYVKANLFLIECLQVAGYVSNREEIKSSLLLPPKRNLPE